MRGAVASRGFYSFVPSSLHPSLFIYPYSYPYPQLPHICLHFPCCTAHVCCVWWLRSLSLWCSHFYLISDFWTQAVPNEVQLAPSSASSRYLRRVSDHQSIDRRSHSSTVTRHLDQAASSSRATQHGPIRPSGRLVRTAPSILTPRPTPRNHCDLTSWHWIQANRVTYHP